MIAYCYRSGEIMFGPSLPAGAIQLISGKSADVRKIIEPAARLAYDGRTLLVPGIPEAGTDDEALYALERFQAWIDRRAAAQGLH